MLSAILSFLRGYRKSFTSFEMAILDELRRHLPIETHHAFDCRIRHINMIQPILGGQEINLYSQHKGKIVFPESEMIISNLESIKIATVALKSQDKMTRLKCKLYCGRGVLTSLEFDQPSEHADVYAIASMKVHINPAVRWAKIQPVSSN